MTVFQYVENGEGGPTLEDFRFYFIETAKKEWNRQAITVAVGGFRAWLALQPFDLGEFSDDYLRKIVVERFKKLRKKWTEGQLQEGESIEDAQVRLDTKREKLWLTERRRNRRWMVSDIYDKEVAFKYV